MACRIKNRGTHMLCVDLVGADSMYLRPGEISGPMRDEHLTANPYLSEWERAGIIERVRVPLSEVLAAEAPQQDSMHVAVASADTTAAADAGGDETSAADAGGDETSGERRDKRPDKDRRRRAETKTEE